ncbi:11912_t:CDS:10 [Acaulospora morrowiae]|uniref:11912_t:CDS:1 n=1 Tax=Acaulospora morrowiae TaxID=94023 RepID=A0A9N9GB96_9GLOM|nr:11912_t:CDS:10 [Acaulospora morrowiae]
MNNESEYFDDSIQLAGNPTHHLSTATAQMNTLSSDHFSSASFNLLSNDGTLGGNSSVSGNQEISQKGDQQPYIQQSAYNMTNISSSHDPLFNLGVVTGSDLSSEDSTNVSSSATSLSIPRLPTPAIGLYSSTGFDIIGVLARVDARRKRQITIGPVDMSCSFLVVDARKFDFPIVYASHTFERLTGYSYSEIIGRNCRFLQAPDGHVALGSRRRFTDNSSVHHLKNQIMDGKDCQISIINYKKGGQPFLNLITVIPITLSDDDEEIIYFVGLQVDLVEQPTAIAERMKDGTYVVNYSMNIQPYIPPSNELAKDQSLDYFRDGSSSAMPFPASSEVFELIGGNTDVETVKASWNRMLLEHSVDFIHVLSLKGLFLYCSAACRRILEYDPDELVGRSLSTICHPSDIVSVMRELKECSNSTEDITLAYRIRRKNSGYIWFEAHGKLHLEKGKGRKCVILSARERPVYKLQQKYLQITEVTYEQEFWSKLSVDGLFLYVSSTCQNLLGLTAEELVGTSLYYYVRSDRTTDISRALAQTNNGIPNNLRNQIQKKNGQYINVLLAFYPGDSSQTNNKPSFIICKIKESSNSDPDQPSSTGNQGDENIFEELSTTKGTSWQYELHQMRLANKRLREELDAIKSSKKKRKKRMTSSSNKNGGKDLMVQKRCATLVVYVRKFAGGYAKQMSKGDSGSPPPTQNNESNAA